MLLSPPWTPSSLILKGKQEASRPEPLKHLCPPKLLSWQILTVIKQCQTLSWELCKEGIDSGILTVTRQVRNCYHAPLEQMRKLRHTELSNLPSVLQLVRRKKWNLNLDARNFDLNHCIMWTPQIILQPLLTFIFLWGYRNMLGLKSLSMYISPKILHHESFFTCLIFNLSALVLFPLLINMTRSLTS